MWACMRVKKPGAQASSDPQAQCLCARLRCPAGGSRTRPLRLDIDDTNRHLAKTMLSIRRSAGAQNHGLPSFCTVAEDAVSIPGAATRSKMQIEQLSALSPNADHPKAISIRMWGDVLSAEIPISETPSSESVACVIIQCCKPSCNTAAALTSVNCFDFVHCFGFMPTVYSLDHLSYRPESLRKLANGNRLCLLYKKFLRQPETNILR